MKFKGKKAAELRSIVAELKTKIDAKMGELKDGLSAEETRKIQSDHDALVADFEGASRALEAAEKEEADAESRRRSTEARNDDGAAAERAAGAAREAVEAERTRVSNIQETGRAHKMSDAMIAEHVRKGTSPEDFNAAVLVAHGERQKKEGGPSGGSHNRGIEVTQDETVTRRDAMVEYIMARNNAPGAQMTERARGMYRGMTAIDLIKEEMVWRGENYRGLLPDEIAQRGLMTTSDFPNILANVAAKTLRQSYDMAPRTFPAWTRRLNLTDFKTYNILRRGETPQLVEVNEKGEFERGSITESKETIQLKTYGKVVGLTRQAIINDDLGAMVSIPGDFANSAATLESDLVYYALLANAALNQDSVALFHTNHSNLAASGTAIDIAPLATMRAKMSKQKGLDGVSVLNILAAYLLVPPELETRAEQLLASFIPTKNADVNPQWIRSLAPISEARLSLGASKHDKAGTTASGSATAYYLVSSQVDTIVTATLDGQIGPYIENRVGFDVDGVEIKCRHDFAASAADFRGLQKDPGA